MKKVIFPVAAVAVLLFSVLLSYSDPLFRKPSPSASKGIVDLSAWDFTKSGPVSLNGEWACYDGQLLTPADFGGMGAQKPRLTGYVNLTAGRIDNPSLRINAPKGVRTYRLVVKTGPSSQTFGLKVDNINMSSRLYVGGTLQGESGTPAEAGQGYSRKPQTYNAYFQLRGGRTEILLQTANYDDPFYGTQYTLLFGLQKDISFNTEITGAIELCGAAAAFLLAFFYLCMYLARKKDRWFLFASFEFFGLTLAMLTAGEKLLYFILPSIPFELFAKLQAFCLPVIFVSIIAFTRSTSRIFLPEWYVRINYRTSLVYTAAVIFTPYSVYVYLSGVWGTFLVLSQLCFLWMLRRVYQMVPHPLQKTEVLLSGFCMGALMICLANNLLYNFSWVPSKAVNSVAACIFILLSIAVIALRLMESMEETVQNELAFLQAQIKPHFIYNAINIIISFCYTDGERAAKLLTNFSRYLRLTFDVDKQSERVPLRREIDMIKAYMEIEQARFGDTIRIEYDIEESLLDRQIPPLIIQPLVENAIRHGLRKKEGGGLVTVSVHNPGGAFTIVVKDNGIGIPPGLADRLKNPGRNREGVGLVNVNRRVGRWKNARMELAGKEGAGTVVTITVKPNDKKIRKGARLFENRRHRR